MVESALTPLSEWGTFYVITGSAAAALTGLMFVVIALRSEALADVEGVVRAFGTPTVLHFCGVLLVAAILSVPHHGRTSLSLCLGATGIAGLALTSWVVVQARGQRSYATVLSDWIWHVAMPLVAYAAIAAAAVMLPRWPSAALDVVGAASLFLLFIGIRNAWDSAVWIAARRR